MTPINNDLIKEIDNNPYLNVVNLMDLSDCNSCIESLIVLDKRYGTNNETLISIWKDVMIKKLKFIS